MRLLCAFLLAAVFLLSLGAAPAQAGCGDDTYVVQRGDSLFSIAEKCDITNYVVLMNINYEISNPASIYPGQVIRLEPEADINTPGATGAPQVGGLEPGGTVYIVRPGDSLARIAYLYSTTVAELLRINPQLNYRTTIYPGMRLEMPWDAKRTRGWVGISALTGSYPDTINVRVVDFPAYVKVEFALRLRGIDADYVTAEAVTDARGQARAALRIPYYADEDEIWEVRAVTVDQNDVVSAVSAGIRITD